MNATTKNDVPVTVTLANIDYGATITVPAGNVHEYAGLKSAQLSMLMSLISDQAAGHEIRLSEDDMQALMYLAAETALLTKGLVAAIAYRPGIGEKGGA